MAKAMREQIAKATKDIEAKLRAEFEERDRQHAVDAAEEIQRHRDARAAAAAASEEAGEQQQQQQQPIVQQQQQQQDLQQQQQPMEIEAINLAPEDNGPVLTEWELRVAREQRDREKCERRAAN